MCRRWSSRALAAAVLAGVALAAGRFGPGLLSSAPAAPAIALGTHFERGLPSLDFLELEPAHRVSWLDAYEQSDPVVAPLLPRVAALPGRWRLVAVADHRCPDALHTVPALARLAELSPDVELRVRGRDQAQDLLDAYPLDGRGRVPLVVVLDANGAERGAWIERPAALRALVAEWSADPTVTDRGARIRAWYGADGGRSALEEIVSILETAAATGAAVPMAAAEGGISACGAP